MGGREGVLRSEKLRSSHRRVGLRAYQCVLDVALQRLLRQTRCSVCCPVPLCVRYSLGQPEVPWLWRREATVRLRLAADGSD